MKSLSAVAVYTVCMLRLSSYWSGMYLFVIVQSNKRCTVYVLSTGATAHCGFVRGLEL